MSTNAARSRARARRIRWVLTPVLCLWVSAALAGDVVLRDYFLRGDADQNGRIAISDPVGVFRHLFLGDASAVACDDAADADDSGRIQVADGIYVLNYLFLDGPRPEPPFPECGRDPSADRLECAAATGCVPPAGSFVFYGVPYDAIDTQVVFVVDRSGSMLDSGELLLATSEIASAVGLLPEESSFGIVIFDTNVLRFPVSGRAAAASPEMVETAIAFLGGIGRGGGSCVQRGLLAALSYVDTSTAKNNVVFYVGDGGGTCPFSGGNEASYLQETLKAVTAANAGRAVIHTFGVLLNARVLQAAFLEDLAAQNGGTFRRVP